MKSKNKIMDSFEEFIREHVSILKNRIIQITGFRSDFVSSKSINVDVSDNIVRINCINNEGAYNLLSSVIYKRKMLHSATAGNPMRVDSEVHILGDVRRQSLRSRTEKKAGI